MIRLLFSNLCYRFAEWRGRPAYTYVDVTKAGL